MYLTNQILADICAPILAKLKIVLKHVLKDSNKHIDSIDEIVLVGGSGKMPVVQGFIEYLTGKKPRTDIDPDNAIAYGAGIVTGIKARDKDVSDFVMTDICPFSLGTEVFNQVTNTNHEFSPIIERNTALPVSSQRSYTTLRDNQNVMDLSIYQGESSSVLNNVWLGNLLMPVPPEPAGKVSVTLRFTYDINGILEVDATCLQTGETRQKLVLTNSSLREEELNERRAELQKLKISPRDQDENRYLLERGARCYEEHTGAVRDTVKQEADVFLSVLDMNLHPAEFEKVRRRFRNLLDFLEKEDMGLFGETAE